MPRAARCAAPTTVSRMDIELERLLQQRNVNYRRTRKRRVRTVEEARAFVDDVGFCHFWPIKDVEMPNLFQAIAGRDRPVPMEHGDPDMNNCWGWKDAALDKRWWYYGKLLGRRATLVSLDVLPLFYAVSENFGSLTDYLTEYQDGKMTAEAKQLYEALLEHGPLDKVRLRREARLSSDSAKSRVDRALVELQVGLKVLPVGVSQAGAWNYAFVYELFQRWFPEVPTQARSIKRSEAQQRLVQRYLDNVVLTDQTMIERVFRGLRWTGRELEQTIAALLEKGTIQEVQVEGTKQLQLVPAAFLDCTL